MDVPCGVVRAPKIVDRYIRALDAAIVLDSSTFRALEREFVEVARPFSEWLAISYGAWRDVGVSPAVLRRARIAPFAFATL